MVHHGEVGQRAACVAQRPDDQHGVGDLVKQPRTPRETARSTRPGHTPGARRARRRTRRRQRVRLARRRRRTSSRGAGHQPPPHRAGRPTGRAARAPRGPRRGPTARRRAPGRPAGVRSVPTGPLRWRHPLLRAVELRRQPPPAARLGAAEARPAPSSSSAPSASSSHTATAAAPNRGPQLRRRARRRARRRPCAPAAAIATTSSAGPSASGLRHSPASVGAPRRLAEFLPPVAAVRRGGGSCLSTAAAISGSGMPRRGGHVGELPGRLGRRPAVPLHQHAPGHRDDGRHVRLGARQRRARAAGARRPRRASAGSSPLVAERFDNDRLPPTWPPRCGNRTIFAQTAKRSADLHPRRELD